MIMTPMSDIVVSAVPDDMILGARANAAARANQGQRKRGDRFTIPASP